jgi:hypothetical protein
LDLAEPAHEAGQQLPWHPIGQKEVEVFLQKEAAKKCGFHQVFKFKAYTRGSPDSESSA